MLECVVGKNESPVIAPIEIKTFSDKNLIEKCENMSRKNGKVIISKFGDDVFKECVSNISYHVQVLHHALVFNAKQVIFVPSSANSIIFALLIHFKDDDLSCYKKMLSHFVHLHLSWVGNGSNIPIKKLSEKALSGCGYHVDVQSIAVHFGLWKRLHEMVISKKNPFPKCTQIVPQSVAYWNKSKVFIDVMSRYMLHIKIPFKKSNPVLQLLVRNIMYLRVNGFLSTQYEDLHKSELMKDDTISYIDL